MAEKDLGYRRVQCTGRGSYIISLPKEWIQDIGLKRGSEIAFNLEPDLSLTLIPRKIREKTGEDISKLKEYYVSVDPEEDIASTLRMIQSLYVISADVIRVHFRGKPDDISKGKAAIKNYAKENFLGAEIIDETNDEVTLQILVKHSEFPIEKAVRRMVIVTLAAHRDVIVALKGGSKELYESIVSSQHDAHRLGLYIVRQLKFGIEHNMYRELGFRTPKEFLLYRIIVNDIKDIGENAINIMNNLVTVQKLVDDQLLFFKDPTMDEEVHAQLLNLNSVAHQMFEDATKAMFKRDYNDAEALIPKRQGYVKLENDLIKLMSSKKMDPNISAILRLVLDSCRRILDYAQDVAELTLNRTVEELCASFAVK
ncbi:MAG: phosphate uptake regulator PhoU [Candidatus Bathyarchaeota archaeon]|nr:phosphate uptake regulator PhoU [Candidatus Bathyarchaeota archaeon]